MSRTLTKWVDYIQTLHARTIDLSLERVAEVYRKMYPNGVPYRIVTVAGTNGKGSTAEILASIYRNAGYSVGKYTSPHLVRFNERINVNGVAIEDDALVEAFDRVERQRGDVSLTFFEFGTLLAIDLFARANVDVAIMEVGLGGRLDAVNILEPDISVITSIALDHTAWLGDTEEQILFEKFGITRAGTPCVVAMTDPPSNLESLAQEKSVPLWRAGHDFHHEVELDDFGKPIAWSFRTSDGRERLTQRFPGLPLPFSQAGHQLQNAAAAVSVVQLLEHCLNASEAAIREGLKAARNPGRCQVMQEDPWWVVDVSHNPASVAALGEFLDSLQVKGDVVAVCGMLRDKEISPALAEITPMIRRWHVATIDDERGTSAAEMAVIVGDLYQSDHAVEISEYATARQAFEAAQATLDVDDCLVVFGSFFISGDIIAHLQEQDTHG